MKRAHEGAVHYPHRHQRQTTRRKPTKGVYYAVRVMIEVETKCQTMRRRAHRAQVPCTTRLIPTSTLPGPTTTTNPTQPQLVSMPPPPRVSAPSNPKRGQQKPPARPMGGQSLAGNHSSSPFKPIELVSTPRRKKHKAP
jgi:hypothetical protein